MIELYSFERSLAGDVIVAGTDEVGAGPLAGPVVAAAVILPRDRSLLGLNDSKQLSAAKRDLLYEVITTQAVAWQVAEVSAAEIDASNIYLACLKAMREAVLALAPAPALLLVDARTLPQLPMPQQALIKGDARCASIAAASIIAKVHRDRLMIELDRAHPGYGFAQHKGYGSEEHLAALRALGPSPEHRKSFSPMREMLSGQLSLF